MKRFITITLICIFTLSITVTSSYAVKDGAIKRTESNVWTYRKVITAKEAKNNKKWKKGYYKVGAKGYVTLKKYNKKKKKWVAFKHYTNTQLLCMGMNEKWSGRVWGTGKVTANTGYSKSSCGITPDYYGCSVWYGW